MSVLGLLNSVLLVLPMIITSYLGFYAWKRRNIPGAISFMFAMLIVGAWCATSLLVVVSSDTQSALFWVKLMLAVVPYLPVFILLAVIQIGIHKNLAKPRLVVLLLIVPSLTALLSLTSNQPDR